MSESSAFDQDKVNLLTIIIVAKYIIIIYINLNTFRFRVITNSIDIDNGVITFCDTNFTI